MELPRCAERRCAVLVAVLLLSLEVGALLAIRLA